MLVVSHVPGVVRSSTTLEVVKQTHITHLLVGFDVTVQCLDVLELLSTLVTLGFRLILMCLHVNIERFLTDREEPVLKEPPTGGLSLANEGAQVAVKLALVVPVEHCMHLLLIFTGKPLPTKWARMQVEGADIMVGLVVVDCVGGATPVDGGAPFFEM